MERAAQIFAVGWLTMRWGSAHQGVREAPER